MIFITLGLFQLYHIIKDFFSKIDEQDNITEFLEKDYEELKNIDKRCFPLKIEKNSFVNKINYIFSHKE